MIDFTARMRHYLDHMAPVWLELPEDSRGRFFVPPRLVDHALKRGVNPTPYAGSQPPWGDGGGAIVVAATQDYRRALPARRPIVFMQHGNGQSFSGEHQGYAGGKGRDAVALFLSPNEYNAALWRRAYPAARVEVVGCPKLDRWFASPTHHASRTVAISFHWDAADRGNQVQEAWSAWRHYWRALPELRDRFDLIGHAHPFVARDLRREYKRLGIPFVADFEEILERAGVYVNDCSSTLYEFAALDRPVVVLNTPEYRRWKEHGLRFWEYADVGVQVDDARLLAAAVQRAIDDAPDVAARRREIIGHVYPYRDAARRAAAAILSMEVANAD